jgi:hypothetical protein
VEGAVAQLVQRTGGALFGVIFFGSRRTGAARADVWSAHDFFVVVESYRAFYRALHAAGLIHRRPATMAAVSRLLPPSQVSLRLEGQGGQGLHAKCAVIDVAAFRRETSGKRRDHFCAGRLFQPTAVVYAKDAAAGDILVEGLVSAHLETYAWVRPCLPPQFEPATY